MQKQLSENKKMSLVFMGTPDFAVASLVALVEAAYTVAAVVTAPDRPAGRGRKIKSSPVKTYALEQGIPVMQPENLKDALFVQQLTDLQVDLFVVVAFRMLPRCVWTIPPKGTFNLHASLLPAYRGAAPINWAIIKGETRTGVTSFFINEEIDTGDIILQEEELIFPDDTAGSLHDKLMNRGASLVVQTVEKIRTDCASGHPQKAIEGIQVSPAPKLSKEMVRIDWSAPAQICNNLIRGLSPYPGAYTFLRLDNKQMMLKVFHAEIVRDHSAALVPGTVVTDNKTYLCIQTGDELLSLSDVQPEGRKRMDIRAFLQGTPPLSDVFAI